MPAFEKEREEVRVFREDKRNDRGKEGKLKFAFGLNPGFKYAQCY